MTGAPAVAAPAAKPVEIFATQTPGSNYEQGFASILAKLMGKRVADVSGTASCGKSDKKIGDKRSESSDTEDAAVLAGDIAVNQLPLMSVPLEAPTKRGLNEVVPDFGMKAEGAIEETQVAIGYKADRTTELVSHEVAIQGEIQSPLQTSLPIASPSEKRASTPAVEKGEEITTDSGKQAKPPEVDSPTSIADPDSSDLASGIDQNAVEFVVSTIVPEDRNTETTQNRRSPSPPAEPLNGSRETSLTGAQQSPAAESNPRSTKLDDSHPAGDESQTVLTTHTFVSTKISTPSRPAGTIAKSSKATISMEGAAMQREMGRVRIGEGLATTEAKAKEAQAEHKIAVNAQVEATPIAAQTPESSNVQLTMAQATSIQPTGEKAIGLRGTHPPEDVPIPHTREIELVVPTTSGVHIAHLADAGGQSEMRIGLRTSAFGTVEVRAVVHDSQVGLAIGAERGELHRLFADEVPGISGRLEQQNLHLDAVKFVDHGSSPDAGVGSGSDPRGREPHPSRIFAMNSVGRGEAPVETIEAVATLEARSGLNVRA